MSLFKSLANAARRSNQKAFDDFVGKNSVPQTPCCRNCMHCIYLGINYEMYYNCSKHNIDFNTEEVDKYKVLDRRSCRDYFRR